LQNFTDPFLALDGEDLRKLPCICARPTWPGCWRDRAGRSPDWIKVKNRKHPAIDRVKESFA
jgi:hypothetical protein